MKTTVEIPDHLLRKIKSLGVAQGFSIRQFITQAVLDRLLRLNQTGSEKPWLKAFGAMKHLHRENERIQREISEEFEKVNSEDWL